MRTRALFFALTITALVFGFLISVLFRNWVRQEIVMPIAFVLWISKLAILSIDQVVYWWILVVICCLIAFYNFWPTSFNLPGTDPIQKSSFRSRYAQWYSYLNNLEESQFVGNNLAREMIRLTVQILSYQYNLEPDEIYRMIDHGEISLPEDFLTFLQRRDFVYKPVPRPAWLEFIYQYLPRPQKSHLPNQLTPVETEVESILKHIENLISPQDNPMEVPIEQPTSQHADS